MRLTILNKMIFVWVENVGFCIFTYCCSETTTDMENNKLLLVTTEKVVTILLS